MTDKLTAIVIAKNAGKKIRRCLDSVAWCGEILIVDDASTDSTVSEAEAFSRKTGRAKVKILKKELSGDFSAQRNFALNKAENDWLLYVDADEIVTRELKNEIINELKDPRFEGYFIPRRDIFFGRKLEYGETGRIELLRLAKKNAGLWQGKVHEKWIIRGKKGHLHSELHHYSHESVASFLDKINGYTDIVAQYWIEQGRQAGIIDILAFPAGKFLYNYFLKLGFLDGVPGLIMAVMMSFHSFLVRGKVYINRVKNG